MPDVAGAISSVSGNLPGPMDYFNSFSSLAQNYSSQKFSERMYNKQKGDAIEFWNMQNAYNSPEQMMQRYTDAGLNKNLIYGSGGSNSAGNLDLPDMKPVDFREPRIGGSGANMSNLLLSADLRIKNAQADNLKVQNEVIRQDAYLRAQQAAKEGLNVDLFRDTYGYQADAYRENVRKTRTETDVLINRDAREAVANATSVAEATERMLTMQQQRTKIPYETDKLRAEIDNLRRVGILDDFEIALRKNNLSFRDPAWQRYVSLFLDDIQSGNFMKRVEKYLPNSTDRAVNRFMLPFWLKSVGFPSF